MRTTIQLDDQLHDLARRYALTQNMTFTALLEQALREKLLTRRVKSSQRLPIKLKTVKGNGLRQGIDLDNNAALLDLMDDY
ncbi:hypothetical protein [Thiolinea disciformis]|uniref:hypothetical protein n=1 Tax=Thiolinea disciformis TaxID=125614 RepID=UPI00036DE290|nr:hypothetical protein [Thiolinea disciformis]